MKKNRLLSVISILLIVSGVILLALPRITSYVIEKRATENVSQVEEIPAETLQENLERDSEFDFDSILEINPSGAFLESSQVDETLIIGRLIIPSIDLNLTVFNGVTNSILHAGVGTMRPGLKMGEGNFPIAGHYTRHKNTLFGDLTSVEIGDSIYLTDNDQTYEYKVYETKTVQPYEIEWIYDEVADQRGTPVISLMNCYYVNGKNSGLRYFVFGELIEVHDADKI